MNAEGPALARGRPRAFCLEAALSAALQVFWRKGFEGASLSDLTDAMQISRPSLYAAFGNKEALFRKALDLYQREKFAFVANALEAPTARGVAARMLFGALDAQAADAGPHGCLFVIHSVACGAEAEFARLEVASRRAALERALLARLEGAERDGDMIGDVAPVDLVRFLLTVITGMGVQAGARMPRHELERTVATTLLLWPTR